LYIPQHNTPGTAIKGKKLGVVACVCDLRRPYQEDHGLRLVGAGVCRRVTKTPFQTTKLGAVACTCHPTI
jgi:hypothetical protein